MSVLDPTNPPICLCCRASRSYGQSSFYRGVWLCHLCIERSCSAIRSRCDLPVGDDPSGKRRSPLSESEMQQDILEYEAEPHPTERFLVSRSGYANTMEMWAGYKPPLRNPLSSVGWLDQERAVGLSVHYDFYTNSQRYFIWRSSFFAGRWHQEAILPQLESQYSWQAQAHFKRIVNSWKRRGFGTVPFLHPLYGSVPATQVSLLLRGRESLYGWGRMPPLSAPALSEYLYRLLRTGVALASRHADMRPMSQTSSYLSALRAGQSSLQLVREANIFLVPEYEHTQVYQACREAVDLAWQLYYWILSDERPLALTAEVPYDPQTHGLVSSVDNIPR